MHSEPEDRLYPLERKRGPTLHIILIIIAIAIIGAAIYIPGWKREAVTLDEPPTIAPAPITAKPEPAVAMPPAPDIPRPPAPAIMAKTEPHAVAAPVSLATSDEDIRQMLGAGNPPGQFTQVLQSGDLVLRSAALIDGVSHGLVPRKILPLKPPGEKFRPIIVDGKPYLDPAGYQRFDSYANGIVAIDPGLLVAAFHRFRPLIETAYEELGYTAEELDNALIRSLDYVLATPVPAEGIALKRKEAVFQYADPELEQLPPLQKQILRMGPDNSAMIKDWVRKLRLRLLGEKADD